MREGARQRRAFDRYLQLGEERSIARLHAELRTEPRPPSLRSLEEWSRLFHWQHRLDEFERASRIAEDEARIKAIREMQDRQAREALLLQQKGAESLAALEPGELKPEVAVRAVVEGARLERLARGEVTERTELRDSRDSRLEALTDGELERLIELAQAGLAGAEPPAP